ncbi:aldehyde dehydrogenase [Metabacillus sp. GX 13764]|uniref:aldehyde dehydrogenase n=1 Tax=Metabacillus kandeliae TaxID=2900151 RepID=UPI001E301B6A|nr:aldehyde dehydrogenase [Metabacillus kandeliae]MCD7036044.1 aldehyde dehydrogenase [Metabacillus kandeliae]
MKTYQAFIDGQFVDSSNGETMEARTPASDEVFAEFPSCTEKDVENAVDAAAAAYKDWKKLPSVERSQYVQKLAALLNEEENQEKIGRAISQEMGKPLSAAKGEVAGAAGLAEYHSQWARRIEGTIVDADSSNERILIYKEPLGVVACIVPWNFPIYVLMRKLAPALIAGNTIVAKPSCKSAVSALVFAELIEKACFPKGVVNIVTGTDETAGDALTLSDKISMITFTGSTKVGKMIAERASKNMVRTSLELGGKAPAIVMEDADLDLAAKSIAGGRLANSGQVCSNTERVYVHKSIKDQLLEKLKTEFEACSIGDGFENPDVQMGCMVHKNEAKRVHKLVEEAKSEGAEVITGGHFIENLSEAFYPPTLLDSCSQNMKIVKEEVFGPVLPIVTFSHIDEAIQLANDSIYGLTSNVYTNNYQYVMKLTTQIEAGEVYVNRQQGEAYQGYHAGWKQSGIGGDDGKYGFEEFLQKKTVYLDF